MKLLVDDVSLTVAQHDTAWVVVQVGADVYRYNQPLSRVDAWKLADRILDAGAIDTTHWTRRVETS